VQYQYRKMKFGDSPDVFMSRLNEVKIKKKKKKWTMRILSWILLLFNHFLRLTHKVCQPRKFCCLY